MDIPSLRSSVGLPGINGVQQPVKPTPAQGTGKTNTSMPFSQVLDGLQKTQSESDTLFQKLAAGEDVDLHQVMIASEETDISFRVALAIRDKLVEAYREVIHMSV